MRSIYDLSKIGEITISLSVWKKNFITKGIDNHLNTNKMKTLKNKNGKEVKIFAETIEDTVEIVDILKPVYNFKNDQ